MSAAVASRIIALIRAKPDAVIGLATGSTPEGVYREICRRYSEAASTGDPIDFSKATFFALDEYVGVTADDSRSYHHYLWKKLLGPINANPDRVHIPKGDAIDKDEACAAYEAALKKAGKVDLWIVG
ncbi:MAG: 6-phosphogluconolactonase, partial [Alphaproteobacteria bacterium]